MIHVQIKLHSVYRHLHMKYISNECKCDAVYVMILFSEPTSDSGMNKIIVGIAGLLLGLVFSVGGLMYYKKKTHGERWTLN